MGWDQDSQVKDGLAELRAYHTAEKHSQKLVRKHTQKYSDKTIGARKNGGHSLSVFSRSFMLSIPLALTLPLFSLTAQAEGKWVQAEGQWQYQVEGQNQKGWKEISGSWYYFDPLTGKMQDGWILADGKWYFLKTDTANWGKMAQGWTWVDGYCYFLKDNGTMATEEKTPDGYSISANGQWVQDGKLVHEEGKGVSSRRSAQVEKEAKAGTADGQQVNANGEAQNTVIKGIAGSGGSGGSGGGGSFSGGFSGSSGSGGGSSSGGFGSGGGSSSGSGSGLSFASASGSSASSVGGGFHFGAGNSSATVETGSNQSKLFGDSQSDSVSNTEDNTGFTMEATDEENTFSEEELARRAEKQRKQAEKELAKRKKLLEKIENGQNNNTVEYETEEGEKRTVLFVKGVKAPKLGENGDFCKTEDHGYIDYKAPFEEGQGYFDVNKAPFGTNKEIDRNLCFAAAASNTLHWYLQQNKKEIQDYIKENGDVIRTVGANTYSLREMLNQDVEQQGSLIYQYFKEMYGNNETGYYTVPLMDLFLNGYTPKEDRKTNIEDKNLQPDARGGFLYGIIGTKPQTGMQSVNSLSDLGNSLQHYLSDNFVVCLSYTTFSYNHVVTLWGAEYDESGLLRAVYVTDSDDQDETGVETDVAMKRYVVKGNGNLSYLSNAISEEAKGARINSLQYLRFGGEEDAED
ncbi:IdeS/Mac family cysteine endopeptidase [Oribacterium sinus]|uniref:Cell wall-binding protein n=1 Tax=Oribacterium sinus TaxID=237576 RepID=A0A930DP46_9FIRM|nr:IdeS/Mac family cysteine endopeptidase [Oribacterium sinus]MBF1273192.1 cell wall-binding protein [Oribacterium sinus]